MLDLRKTAGAMRIALAVAVAGAVCFLSSGVEGLAVGYGHACVVLDNGSVKCFGQNQYGQLGLGDTLSRGANASTMGDSLGTVDLGSGATITVVAMSAGSDHTCVILSDGSMKCFGKNDKGQLGLGDTNHRGDEESEMGVLLPAVSLGTNRTAVAVAADGDRTCALLDSGNVRCWGDGEFGGLGSGDETDTGDGMGVVAASVDVGAGGAAVAIGEGPCAVLDDGRVKCWGKGYYGKNGQGTADNVGDEAGEMGTDLGAVPLGVGKLAHSVVGGRDYVCVLLQDGGLKCWGRGEGGQLGNENIATIGDDPDELSDALPTIDLGTDQVAVEVSAAEQHTCALLLSGSVKCWGKNFYGNLGLENFRARGNFPATMGDALPEINLGTGRTVVSLRAGGERTCAILDNGSLKCWGDNAVGQLGLEDTIPRGERSSQMGDDLPAVALGTNRTAVALALAVLPTFPPSGAPTTAPSSNPTPQPSPRPTAEPTVTATSDPTVAATSEPATPATSAPVTPSPTLTVEANDRSNSDSLDGTSTTLIVSVAAPLGILILLGMAFFARRNAAAAAAAVGAKNEDAEGSVHGAENVVAPGSLESSVV